MSYSPGDLLHAGFRTAQRATPTLKARALDLLRRGPNEVDWVPPGLGFGNHLYMWLYSWKRQQAGIKSRILLHDSMRPWLDAFPSLQSLTVHGSKVGLRDRRVIVWGQEFGVDFTQAEIQRFIESCLLTSQSMQVALAEARRGLLPETIVINVRRGDYYSVPEFSINYGMDVKSYVQAAVKEAASATSEMHIRVVSDDPPWCRENLKGLLDYGSVDFGPENKTPLGDLATLAVAETLILANSTFSYWGGYMNGVMRPLNHNRVWAPLFHARHINRGHAWQLDPSWNVVEKLHGGWAAP